MSRKAREGAAHAHASLAKRSLTARLWTKFHMAIILAGVLATGLLVSKLLHVCGVDSMALRYAIAADTTAQAGTSDVHALPDAGVGGSGSGILPDLDVDDSIGIVIAIVGLVAIVAALVFSSAYLIWEAPAILGEAAFQAVLVLALKRRSAALGVTGWTVGVLKATWKAALATTIVVGVVGLVLDTVFPHASTLLEILRTR